MKSNRQQTGGQHKNIAGDLAAISTPTVDADNQRHSSLSMHDNVPVWYDCCSCEAEPYWIEGMRAETDDKAINAAQPIVTTDGTDK